jgi:hypothetical protein
MQPTITKVNSRQGTVTVKMEDKEGREVERVFQLTEDVQYLDSTGQIATLDVFESGDEVLIIETEGKIKEMKKHPKAKKAGDKEKMQSAKTADAKKPREHKAKASH